MANARAVLGAQPPRQLRCQADAPARRCQIAKLLIIPFVCLVELFWMKRRFTTPVVCSILTVVLGVGVV